MAILGKRALEKRIFRESDNDKRLWITPMKGRTQIGDTSVDVRLGNEFLLIRTSNLLSVDVAEKTRIERYIGQYQERIRLGFSEKFILHPNQFVLGSTLEYIGLPGDLAAQVEGRSSWGRLGLIIATATPVAPGFRGVITLELLNVGQAPIVLYPGARIAQLLIMETVKASKYSGKYKIQTGPEFSKIYTDKDLLFWIKKENFL